VLKHIDPTSPSGFRFELTQEEHDAGMVAFLTGPIAGTISLPSGGAYDVTEDAVAVHRYHVGEFHVALHKAHHAAGRFLDAPVPELEAVSLSE
jgi:hypothetical protein